MHFTSIDDVFRRVYEDIADELYGAGDTKTASRDEEELNSQRSFVQLLRTAG